MDLAAGSNQTIWQPVAFTHPVTGAVDPTGYSVEMAVVPYGDTPGDGDWFDATWESGTDANDRHLAKAELGTDETVVLAADNLYRLWVRLTLPSETPVLAGDSIFVF